MRRAHLQNIPPVGRSDNLYSNVMQDAQTLYCRIYRGSVDWPQADTTPVYAVGILHLHWNDFVKYDVFGLRFGGPGMIRWGLKFLRFFLGTNWRFQRLKKTGRAPFFTQYSTRARSIRR